MMNPKTFYLPLILCSGLISVPAVADTFRCNGQIIEEGMQQSELSELCGPPDEVVTQVSDIWIYRNKDDGNDVQVYFYSNGAIEKINTIIN